MIHPKDLRIGNLVRLPEVDETYTIPVLEICSEGIIYQYGGELYPCGYDDIDPIPLTPEWLEKLGFERSDERGLLYAIIIGSYQLALLLNVTDNSYTPSLVNLKSQFSLADIKYVHQLQNLYYALTGEELVK